MNFECILVDDDDALHFVLGRFLKKAEFHEAPRSFFNGQEALNFLANEPPAGRTYIVFLDINMPVLNGWNFLEGLKKLEIVNRVKVIMVTSSVDSRDSDKAKTYTEIIEFMIKPVDSSMVRELKNHPGLKELFPAA